MVIVYRKTSFKRRLINCLCTNPTNYQIRLKTAMNMYSKAKESTHTTRIFNLRIVFIVRSETNHMLKYTLKKSKSYNNLKRFSAFNSISKYYKLETFNKNE